MILPFIAPLFSAIMPAVTTAIGAIGTFISTYGPMVLKNITTVVEVMGGFAKAMNVLAPSDNINDLGGRALQAAQQDKRPENFPQYSEYMDYLRKMDYNPEESKFTDLEKTMTGLAITGRGIEEKLSLPKDSSGALAAMIAAAPLYFTQERIQSWEKVGMLATAIGYFTDKLGAADSFRAEQKMIALEKENRGESEAFLERELEAAKTSLSQKQAEVRSEQE